MITETNARASSNEQMHTFCFYNSTVRMPRTATWQQSGSIEKLFCLSAVGVSRL